MKAPHVVPVRVYVKVYAGLMGLLVLTIVAAYLHFPIVWALLAALTIAIVKTGLVVAYFMHVRYSSSMVALFAVAGFYWLMLLFVMTLADYLTRQWPI